MSDLSTLTDLQLVQRYNQGLEQCAVVLFERYKRHLNWLSKNTVHLHEQGVQDKRGIAYLTFLEAFPHYERIRQASFRTYITRCVRNAFLDEQRKEHTQKRIKDLSAISHDSEEGSEALARQIYLYWSRAEP